MAPSPTLPRFAGEGVAAASLRSQPKAPRTVVQGAICPLSREAGEGWGGGKLQIARALNPSQNRLANAIEIAAHVVIVHAQHTIAIRGKPSVASPVVSDLFVSRMRRAVDLDDELCRGAEKIRDKGTARNLSSKGETRKPMRAQPIPELAFDLGEIMPKLARAMRHDLALTHSSLR